MKDYCVTLMLDGKLTDDRVVAPSAKWAKIKAERLARSEGFHSRIEVIDVVEWETRPINIEV